MILWRRTEKAERGYVLAVTLVLCTLVFFLLAYTGLQSTAFWLLNDALYSQRALDATYALGSEAVAKMMYDPTWQDGFDETFFKDPESVASLNFKTGKSTPSGPYGVNNYSNPAPTTGWDGRTIPPGYTNLVIIGKAPENTPGYTLDDAYAIRITRQAMVNVFYRYFLEDFNEDGKGTPRNTWVFNNNPSLSINPFQGGYCYLGMLPRPGSEPVYAEAGEKWWEDYDLEAIVAYYGYGGFGLIVRSNALDGYGVLISPVHSADATIGAAVQFCTTGAIGRSWQPFLADGALQLVLGDDTQENPNPFVTAQPQYKDGDPLNLDFSKTPDFTAPYGVWKVVFSVENKDIDGKDSMFVYVSVTRIDYVNDASGTALKEGSTWVSEKVQQPARTDPLFREKGKIGFFTEPGTLIGITNVVVNKRGKAMVSIPAQWYNR